MVLIIEKGAQCTSYHVFEKKFKTKLVMSPTYQHELYGQTRQTISTIENMLNSLNLGEQEKWICYNPW
jgi:hypothetical protein